MLIRYDAGDNETSALVGFEFEEIARIIAFEEEFAKTAYYADMLRTRGNHHCLFIPLSLKFSLSGIASASLPTISPQSLTV